MNKILVAMALSAALGATAASAQPYAGGGMGVANTDDHNTSYKFFGGFQYTRMLGLELAYNNFGDHRGQNTDSWSLAATGKLPLGDTWDILGKVGVSNNHTKTPDSSRQNDMLTGYGIGYNVNQNLSIRLEFEDFGDLPDDANGNKMKATQWGFNARYSF